MLRRCPLREIIQRAGWKKKRQMGNNSQTQPNPSIFFCVDFCWFHIFLEMTACGRASWKLQPLQAGRLSQKTTKTPLSRVICPFRPPPPLTHGEEHFHKSVWASHHLVRFSTLSGAAAPSFPCKSRRLTRPNALVKWRGPDMFWRVRSMVCFPPQYGLHPSHPYHSG